MLDKKETTKQYYHSETQVPYLIYEVTEPYKKTRKEKLEEIKATHMQPFLKDVENRTQQLKEEYPNATKPFCNLFF